MLKCPKCGHELQYPDLSEDGGNGYPPGPYCPNCDWESDADESDLAFQRFEAMGRKYEGGDK